MTSRLFRIGQIVPSSDTTMETKIPAMLRAREGVRPEERFTFHSSRMRMKRVTREELVAMNAEGVRCAAKLAGARVDVMSTACLVAIMASGAGYQRQVAVDLTKAARENGCTAPVTTLAGALVEGLQTMGARRVALLAPYMRELTDLVVVYIEAEGITVSSHRCFEIADNLEVGGARPDETLCRRGKPRPVGRGCCCPFRLRPDALAARDPDRGGPARASGRLDRHMHGPWDAGQAGLGANRAESRCAVSLAASETANCVERLPTVPCKWVCGSAPGETPDRPGAR